MRPAFPVIAVLLVATSVASQDHFFHLGARAASMGGAFTGVADDSTGFYWNPAGVAFGPFLSAGAYYGRSETDRDGQTFEDRAAGVSLRYTFMGVAFTDFHQRVDSQTLDTFDLAVSVLQSLPLDNLVIAGNVHYLAGTTTVAGSETDSRSWDVDLGVMYELHTSVRFGLMLRNLREARFRVGEDDELRLSRHARTGVSFQLPQSFLVAVDVDLSTQGTGDDTFREVSLGGEKGFFDRRAFVRAGLRAEAGSDLGARPAFSLGGGVQFWKLELELAYVGASDDRHEAYWVGVTLAR